MKKLIVLIVLLFSTFAVYAEPVELVESTTDTSITEVDSTIVDSVMTPLAMIDTELLLMTEARMRTSHNMTTKQDSGAKALRRSPFSGFKRHNTATLSI